MIAIKNLKNGITNLVTTKIRENPKALDLIKKIIKYSSTWEHMLKNDDLLDSSWARKSEKNILVIGNEKSLHVKGFKSCKKIIPNIDIITIEEISEIKDITHYDGLIVCIQHDTSVQRSRYAEVLSALYSKKIKTYPSMTEGAIYENKRCLAEVLNIHGIPSPKTTIINSKNALNEFIKKFEGRAVIKTSLGASASGVTIVNSKSELKSLANLFFGSGFNRPNSDYRDKEWGYLIVQEFIPNVREYRVIKIGKSWFAHEKIADKNGFHSGSGNAAWIVPKTDLLDFCEDVSKSLEVHAAAFDIFESPDGRYLVNEIQCWFGSYSPSQMYINEKPGRYKKIEGNWIFEEGFFNIYGSTLLRVSELISEIEAGK